MESDFNAINIVWVILCAALVFLMQAGFLCLESGLTRTKNSINVAVKNITDFGLSVFVFWAVGFGLMFGASHSGFMGTSLFLTPIEANQPWLSTFFIFQAMFCGTAVTIISGAVAERMSFKGYLLISFFVALLIYPLFGHWAWGGAYEGPMGWLAAIGFVDFAGSTVVHSVGGWVALIAVIMIGPRRGRFMADGSAREIPGQTLPMAMLGALLLFFAWIGFNGGSTLELNAQVPGIVGNTILGGVSGLCCILVVGWIHRKYLHPKDPINGLIGGLVAVTANCHIITGWQAVIIGGIAGIVILALERLLEHLKIDDVVGAFPVHAGAGIWGTLAVAIFGCLECFPAGHSRIEQLGVQLLGVVVCMGVTTIPTYIFIKLLKPFVAFRVDKESEDKGLNISEHLATTEYIDLLRDMETQANSSDLNQRVNVEPFTEVGQIASKYNAILDSLQMTIARDEMIIKDTSDGIISCTEDGGILSANPGTEKMFEWKEDYLIKKNIHDLFEGLDETVIYTNGKPSFKPVSKLKITGKRANGERFPAELECSVRNLKDHLVSTLKIRDVTQRVHFHEQMKKAKESAEKARDELEEKVEEIEAFNRIAVDREIRMIELKETINQMSVELGKEPPYVFGKNALKHPVT